MSADRKALADVLGDYPGSLESDNLEQADRLLASDWLADHDREVREQCAQIADRRVLRGGWYVAEFTGGHRVAAAIRADSLPSAEQTTPDLGTTEPKAKD